MACYRLVPKGSVVYLSKLSLRVRKQSMVLHLVCLEYEESINLIYCVGCMPTLIGRMTLEEFLPNFIAYHRISTEGLSGF